MHARPADGVISREEFQKGLQALTGLHGSPITEWQADEMLRVLDTDGDGSINYSEFVNGFKLTDTAGVHFLRTAPLPLSPRGAGAGAAASPRGAGAIARVAVKS